MKQEEIRRISSEDVNKSRREVDEVYKELKRRRGCQLEKMQVHIKEANKICARLAM